MNGTKGRVLAILLTLIGLVGGAVPLMAAQAQTENPTYVVREGNDFATRVLSDPWDMNEFTDISQVLNNSGRNHLIRDIQVVRGIFSAYSTDANYAQFYVLFPGYEFAMHIGKVGQRFPIASQNYHCLYMRMRVDSPIDDSWYAGWLPNTSQVIEPGQGGQMWGKLLHNDDLPAGSWRIYSVDLANSQGHFYESWTDRPYWKGLRIHPTNKPNVHFEVDWVRLTDCNPVIYDINWVSIDGQSRLWAGIGASKKDFMITDLASEQNSFPWDVQGLEPGEYFIGVEANGETTWLTQSLRIEAAPRIKFIRPSPFSGEDYAFHTGNPWDFSSTSDIISIHCASWSVEQGLLILNTLSPRFQPSFCLGSIQEVDTRIYISLPTNPLIGHTYRYLSFHHTIDGTQSLVADGMIGRLIWKYGNCTQVSEDIPYEVGWQTYSIDLHNPSLGFAEEAAGCGRDYWMNSGQIISLRFDPNENWTGNLVPDITFHQQFDWIRLTKMDQATQGRTYPIKVNLNKPAEDLTALTFYYTTDLGRPTQNLAQPFTPAPPAGPNLIYLPLTLGPGIADPFVAGLEGDVTFQWDTSDVPAGEYTLCAVANDGYNEAIYCSDAPVQIVAP
jgi:hypothetical protein